MRVLFLPSWYMTPESPTTGIFFRDQAIALAEVGIHVDIAYAEPRSLRFLSWNGLKENHFQRRCELDFPLRLFLQKGWNPWMNSVPGGMTWAVMMKRLAAWYVKEYGMPDLVHAHNSLWAGYAAYLLSRERHCPYVVTEHSSELLNLPARLGTHSLLCRTFAGAAKVLAVSASLADSLKPYLGSGEATVIPNLVDTDFFTLPPEEPPRWPFRFLYAGSLDRNKGVGVLLRAFASAFGGATEVQLDVVGDGPERVPLQALSVELGIEENVKFMGRQSRQGVRETMWRSKALVLPSFRETFGVVLVEAMATGLPVIASRSGGPEGIVVPETGLLFNPGDVEGLAGAMQRLVSIPSYSQISLRGHVIAAYGRHAITEKLVHTYKLVLEKGAR